VSELLNIFVRPPGDLVYFLTLIALSQVALLITLRPNRTPTLSTYWVMALGMVLIWVFLLLGALYVLVTRTNAGDVLPPLERTAYTVCLVIVGWAFLMADHLRWRPGANLLALGLLALVVGGYLLTGLQWATLARTVDFNLSVYGMAWTIAPLALSALGMVLILVYFRLVVDAPLKLIFFAVMALGYGLTLWQTMQGNLIGDYAGAVRLAFIAAMCIPPTVVYRAVVAGYEVELSATRAKIPPRPIPIPTRDDAAMERQAAVMLRGVGLLLHEATPNNIPQRIVDTALEILKADVGALLKIHDANYADVSCAYDRVLKRNIPGLSLSLGQQPTLVNAIERQTQRPLLVDRNVKELDDLYTRLDVSQRGPVYMQPLMHGKQLVAVLLVALPYSGRELRSDEEELLRGFALICGSMLSFSYTAIEERRRAEERAIHAMVTGVRPDEVQDSDVMMAQQHNAEQLRQAREQIAQYSRQISDLKRQFEQAQKKVAQDLADDDALSASQQILALNSQQSNLRAERDALAERLQQAETALAGATGDSQTLIEALHRERDDLAAERERLQAQVDELRANDRAVISADVGSMIAKMTSEQQRLQRERDQYQSALEALEAQLGDLGVEQGARGMTQLIAQLHEERNALQLKLTAVKSDRDMLLAERNNTLQSLTKTNERETQIAKLQSEVQHLAADREALTKQRDALHKERDELANADTRLQSQRARLLAQINSYQGELQESYDEQNRLRLQLQKAAEERGALSTERAQLDTERQTLDDARAQLEARSDGDRARMDTINAEGVGRLTQLVNEANSQRASLERDLNDARRQLAELENQVRFLQLTAAQAALQNSAAPTATNGAHDDSATSDRQQGALLMGLVQELRTPMTSIAGYVELLLSESSGILGEMQRKFMQRVLANVNRLGGMLEDLVKLTALDTGKFSLTPEAVNVIDIIEQAVTNAAVQFREKGLAVQLDLQEDAPAVQGDRDAITQIVGQLLSNAYLVTPPESNISIRARGETTLLNGDDGPYPTAALLVSIEDRGGGVAQDDEARVFARKYKADNPLIQGIGDTGVGLAVAKALVEAHGGRLWLETRANLGSVFHFALPLLASNSAVISSRGGKDGGR
jgi:signal transduction histidine kinase